MKTCIKCGLEKCESEFYKDKTRKDGLFPYCKSCHSKGLKEYYETHKREIFNRRKAYHNNARKSMVDWLYEQKTPCICCGEDRPWIIDFHHIDPSTKKFSIGATANAHSKQANLEEISKCVCLCRNCHQEFHVFFGQKPKEPIESLGKYLELWNKHLELKL